MMFAVHACMKLEFGLALIMLWERKILPVFHGMPSVIKLLVLNPVRGRLVTALPHTTRRRNNDVGTLFHSGHPRP